jgi:pyruvate/2-oxoglutarate dehydrogenase complex dihydrolipoamide acyltransferase (E2) component
MKEHELFLPRFSKQSGNCLLISWLKDLDCAVRENEAVLLFESQKASMYLYSPVTGTLIRKNAVAGQWWSVEKPVAVIQVDNESIPEKPNAG